MPLLPEIRKPGDEPLSASEINAIRERLLAAGSSPGRGYDTQGEHVRDYPTSPVDRWPNAWSTEEVEPYSVFAVHGGVITPGGYDNTRVTVSPWGFDTPGSPLVWFTNDTLPVLACKWSAVRPINMYSTAWVRWDGAGSPRVGMWCGPKPDSYAIEGGRFGFVVVNVNGELVEVMRTFEPIAVVGTIVETVTGFDACTKALGHGTLRVEYRRDDGELANAHSVSGEVPECGSGFEEDSGSSSSHFDVEVWNTSPNAFEANECVRVKAVQVLGVGLVVIEPGPVENDTDCCGSEGSEGSGSEGSGSSACLSEIDGVVLADLDVVTMLPTDKVLVLRDGCLKLAETTTECEE